MTTYWALEQVRAALLAAFQHPMRPDSTIEKRLGSAQRDLKAPLGGNVWVCYLRRSQVAGDLFNVGGGHLR